MGYWDIIRLKIGYLWFIWEKNANPFTWQFELLAEKPQLLYFIAFPNVDNRKALEYFKQYYSVKSIKEYEKGGYAIKIYTMVHKL